MAQSEIDSIRDLLKSRARPVGWAERRKRIEEVCAVWPVAGDVVLEAVDVDGLPGEWSIVPDSNSSKVLLFFHGGGYCSGSILSHRRMVTEAGRAAGIRTLAVEYRLAPEHPFPAAYDDALKAWAFLRGQGFGAGAIVVGGDSAGAGLAAALANRLSAEGGERPACAWLVSPWTDLTMSETTMATKDAVDPLIHEGYLVELADAYAPAPIDRKDPRVSPLYADLRRVSAGADPGRVGRDAARRRDPLRRRGGRGRRRRDPRSLAAHDPCLPGVERAPGARPTGAGAGRAVHAAVALASALARAKDDFCRHGRACPGQARP